MKKFEGTNGELAAKIEKLQDGILGLDIRSLLRKSSAKVNAVELALLMDENKPPLQLVKG